jgi:spore germination cell wall hydrolase CwlJ-like protein
MRKNQIILDEAARSVRRAFLSSVAGSATMLGVIGVAGAYGVPERLSAHSLSNALTTLQIKLTPMVDAAAPAVERATVAADHLKQRMQSVSIESDDEIILQVPRVMLAAAGPVRIVAPSRIERLSAPVSQPVALQTDVIAIPEAPVTVTVEKPVATPVEKVVAAPAEKPVAVVVEKPVAKPADKFEPAPVVTAALSAPVKPESVKPEPAKSEPAMPVLLRPARAMPGAMPDVASQPVGIPAPLVFEQPDLDKIRPLTELPKIEIVEPPKAVEVPVKREPEPKKPEPQKAASEKPAPVAAKSEQPKPEQFKPEQLKLEQPNVVASLAPDLPKAIETAAEKPAEHPTENAAMSAMASATTDTPSEDEYPKTVMVYLPLPKPPMSPAQLLELHDTEYDKAQKCLAQAIYFESRAEPVRGQQAVAQVVLNRVFSPYYPKDVCSVVYQNAHRHLSCQFTFACDGKPEAINERGAWARANRIARQALDAKVWLPEVAKATHYHATYVRPNWISDMKMLVKTGVHIFYRPRNWGDGAKEQGWGTPNAAAAAAPLPGSSKKKS